MASESIPDSSAASEFDQALAWFRARRFSEARQVCREILHRQPGHSGAWHLLGLILADRGETGEALGCLEQGLQYDRQNPALLGAYALILLRSGRLAEAENAARAALSIQPQLADVLDILGSIRWRRGDLQEARSCFERALKLSPAHPGAWGNLALLAEQANHAEEAESRADEGLKRNPEDVSLRLVKGRCLRRRGEFAAAGAMFEALAHAGTEDLQRDAEYELALCSDALGDAAAAFTHSERANHLARRMAPGMLGDARDFMAQIHDLRQQFSPAWVASWQPLPPETGGTPPAFLVGFPRSGTTLLDSMLGAHPDMLVLEERATEQALVNDLDRLPGGYPQSLRTLTEEQHTKLREGYFQLAAQGQVDGKRLLDKSPFMTVHLGLVSPSGMVETPRLQAKQGFV